MKQEFIFNITIGADGILQTSPSSKTIGHIDDNNSIRLIFERPEGFSDYNLKLTFYDGINGGQVFLGTENVFDFNRPYTSRRNIFITPSFTGDNGYKRSAGTITLQLDDIVEGAAALIPPWPDPIENLADNAWYGDYEIDEATGEFIVRNAKGEIVARLPPPGSGGGDGGSGGTVDQTARDMAQAAQNTASQKANKIVQQQQGIQTMYDYFHAPVPSSLELPVGTVHTPSVTSADIVELASHIVGNENTITSQNKAFVTFKSVSGDFYVQAEMYYARRGQPPSVYVRFYQKQPEGNFTSTSIYGGPETAILWAWPICLVLK